MDKDEWEIYKILAMKKPEWVSGCRVKSVYPGCLIQVVRRFTMIPENARQNEGFINAIWKNCRGCQHCTRVIENGDIYGEY